MAGTENHPCQQPSLPPRLWRITCHTPPCWHRRYRSDKPPTTSATLCFADARPTAPTMKDTSHPSSSSPSVSALFSRNTPAPGWALTQPRLPPFVQAAPVDTSAISATTAPFSSTPLGPSVEDAGSRRISTICDVADASTPAPLQSPHSTLEKHTVVLVTDDDESPSSDELLPQSRVTGRHNKADVKLKRRRRHRKRRPRRPPSTRAKCQVTRLLRLRRRPWCLRWTRHRFCLSRRLPLMTFPPRAYSGHLRRHLQILRQAHSYILRPTLSPELPLGQLRRAANRRAHSRRGTLHLLRPLFQTRPPITYINVDTRDSLTSDQPVHGQARPVRHSQPRPPEVIMCTGSPHDDDLDCQRMLFRD